MIPRIVVAAPGSGSGKTTVTLAIMAALRKRGLRVAPFKVGPDYIDPQLHRVVCGRPSFNLDTWLTGRDNVLATFERGTRDADIAVIEGVMGLFDGSSPDSYEGSAAEIAVLLGAPVILVVDASGMAGSVAALVRGFTEYAPEVPVRGVILNRLGGEGHYAYLKPALAKESIAMLGFLPRDGSLTIPERHLGLVPASELDRVTPMLERLLSLTEKHLDIDGIVVLARAAPAIAGSSPSGRSEAPPPCIRIAWAEDRAFNFSYEENKEILRELGAEIVPFSPLLDAALPAETDGLWLGGGFPEEFAEALAANLTMIGAIRDHAARGKPIYAECGGFMYLCEWFEDRRGARHELVGLCPGGTRMTDRLQRFGYAEATFMRDTILGPRDSVIRGHRFHYSEYVPYGGGLGGFETRPYRIRKNTGGEVSEEGFATDSILATYFHVHLAAFRDHARRFVRANKGE